MMVMGMVSAEYFSRLVRWAVLLKLQQIGMPLKKKSLCFEIISFKRHLSWCRCCCCWCFAFCAIRSFYVAHWKRCSLQCLRLDPFFFHSFFVHPSGWPSLSRCFSFGSHLFLIIYSSELILCFVLPISACRCHRSHSHLHAHLIIIIMMNGISNSPSRQRQHKATVLFCI